MNPYEDICTHGLDRPLCTGCGEKQPTTPVMIFYIIGWAIMAGCIAYIYNLFLPV